MARQVNINDTLTTHPTSIDENRSNYTGIYSTNVLENAYTDASSTTRAAFYTVTGSSAETDVYLLFDECANIPAGATINSISCSVKCGTQGTSYFGTRTVQLYSGTTAKGSATTMSGSNSSPSTHNLTTGSWTGEEIQDIQLRFRVVRGSSNTTTDATFSVYGATLTISYSFNGTMYTIAAVSNVDGITASPSSQELAGGESGIVTINGSSIDDLSITDNGNDISNLLIQKAVETGGTIEAVPQSYTTRGSISGTRYQSTVGHGVDNPSSQSGNDYCSSRNSTATIYYHFNFDDIPDNATIVSMTVQAYGHLESTSQSSEVAELNTYYGTTAKGTVTEYTSSSSQIKTIPAGNWTVAQLKDDARVGFTIGYYGGLTTGITWTVEYSVPSSGNDYYWEYRVENINDDHVILIEEAGVYVPPEEDPEETYWPITISSINATTNPANGTVRIVEGTNQTITITPTDPQLTLALDNGVDITNQLHGGTPTNTYTVSDYAPNANYGFSLNTSTGYYVSTNDGINKSASVARLNLNFESECLVTIQYINYAEASYDYGMFGKLDTAVATDGLTASNNSSSPSDSTSNYQLAMCSNSSSAQTITYEVPMGEHFIDIKYGKDDASESGNDNLQWKVLSIEATSIGGDYTYTLTNVTQKHSLIFVFGDVDFWYVTSSGTSGMRLFPDGQQVKLDGDNYLLNIVPDNISSTITITDNGNDVTSSLERETGVDKNNNPVVSYKYKLNNITANHTINVTAGDAIIQLYVKENDTWRMYSKVYKKINGSWVEQSDISGVFSTSANYVKGN